MIGQARRASLGRSPHRIGQPSHVKSLQSDMQLPRASQETTKRHRPGISETPIKVRQVRELPQELTTFGNDRGSFFLAYDREQANRDNKLGSMRQGSQRHSTISFPELKKAYRPRIHDNYPFMGSAKNKRHLSSIVGPTIKMSDGAQRSSKLPSIYTAERIYMDDDNQDSILRSMT